jgi:hypothetical protein
MPPVMGPPPIWDFGRFREEDRLSALCELQDWVTHTLSERYKLGGDLPECWVEHPCLVEALVLLHEWEVEARRPEEISRWCEAARAAAKSWAFACRLHLALRGAPTAIVPG